MVAAKKRSVHKKNNPQLIQNKLSKSELLTFFTKVHRELSKSLNYQDTIESLGKLAVPTISDWFLFDRLENNGEISRLVTYHQNPKFIEISQDLRKNNPTKLDAKFGVGKVIRSGQSELISKITTSHLKNVYKNKKDFARAQSTKPISIMIVPVKTQRKVFGAFTFITTSKSNRHFSDTDLMIAEDFAISSAFAIQNSALYDEIEKSEQRFKHLFNGINEAVLILNNQGICIDANQAAKKMLKISNMDFGKIKIGRFHAKGNEFTKEILQQLKKKPSWSKEINILTKTKKQIFVELRAQQFELPTNTFYSLVLHDLTESQRASETNARLAALVASSDEAIVGQSLKGQITSWNKGAEKMYGYKASQVVGHHIELLYPDDLLHEISSFRKRILRGKSIDHFQTQRIHQNGHLIDISISVAPIKDAFDNIIGISTISRDITHQKEVERRKDEFLSIASHELKTPITSIKAYAQILEKYFLGEEEDKCLIISQRMNRQIENLSQLVYDLLDVSKIELGQIKFNYDYICLYTLLKDSIEGMQPLAQQEIKLVGKSKMKIYADEYRLSQVMTNLLTNAIKYSPKNSEIIITINKEKDDLIVSVQDFGIGIDPQFFNQLFNRFYRVKQKDSDSYGGLGLGLYISHQIIERQGGKMWVKSKPNQGSTFFFSLPIKKRSDKISTKSKTKSDE